MLYRCGEPMTFDRFVTPFPVPGAWSRGAMSCGWRGTPTAAAIASGKGDGRPKMSMATLSSTPGGIKFWAVGHAPQDVVDAIRRQSEQLPHVFDCRHLRALRGGSRAAQTGWSLETTVKKTVLLNKGSRPS